jgi:hypothetical protein
VRGDATLTLRLLQPCNTIALDYVLGIDSVAVDGSVVAGADLAALPMASHSVGDTVTVRVWYYTYGYVESGGWGGLHVDNDMTYNLGVGFDDDPHIMGRAWFPCRDNFYDKATYTLNVTTKAGWTAECGGIKQSTSTDGDGCEHSVWRISQPTPTYLVSVSQANWQRVQDTIHSLYGDYPATYGYLYPTENVYVNRPAKAKDPYPLSNIKYTSYNGTTITPLTYNDFKPSYNYVVTPAADVPAVVKANAGYGKLGWTEAPVAVNNGGVSGYNGSDDNPTDPDPDDPDNPDQPAAGLSEGWSWVNNGATATYSVASDGKLSIASTGKWESKAQTFGMAYREVSGDFTATVRLVSYTPQKSGSNQAVAGLMLVGSNVSDTATDLLFTIVGNVYVNSRIEKGKDKAGASLTAPSGSGCDTILRLVREGSKVKMSYSLDGGATFSSISSKEFVSPLPESVKIGLGVNSGDNSKQSTAVFADFKINDTKIDF